MQPVSFFHTAASVRSIGRVAALFLALLLALTAQTCSARTAAALPEGLPGLSNQPSMVFDHYTFAVMWLPGLCLSWNDIDDVCQRERHNPTVMQHFSLHGLWPSLPHGLAQSGMQPPTWWHYGCYWYQPGRNVPDSCSLEPVPLPNELRQRLDAAMPLTATCLDRHEYSKHVACFGPPAAGFFAKAITLLDRLNATPFAQWVSAHRGQTVSRHALQRAFMHSFRQTDARALELRCGAQAGHGRKVRDLLTQVWITIPSDRLDRFPQPNSLGKGRRGNCASRIRIAAPEPANDPLPHNTH